MLLMQEIGHRLVPGPFIGAMLAGYALLEGGSEEQRADILPRLSSADLVVVPALQGQSRVWSEDSDGTRAVPDGDGYRLHGVKSMVEFAHVADLLLVGATVEGDEEQSVFLLDPAGTGVHRTRLDTIDGIPRSRIRFDGAYVSGDGRLPAPGGTGRLLRNVALRGSVAQCAWMVGGASWVQQSTTSYVMQREQFGRPIGSFQAIQHRCANILVEYEAARHLMLQAAWRLSEGLDCDREVAIAKARVGQAFNRICTESHQVHGAIGFTAEYPLHLYTRRARVAERVFGDARRHREQLAEILRLEGPEGSQADEGVLA
jgi:alkylation response protein AidB-like acyl-CoA dehydrogenase